jgi:glycosyltransferase involved in cell wall biosynthesis
MNKKVLFVSSETDLFRKPCDKALKYAGFEVFSADFLNNAIMSRKTFVHKVIRRIPPEIRFYIIKYGRKKVDKEILKKAIAIKPDFILVFKAKYMLTATLDKLRAIAPLINWYPETMNNWGTIKGIVKHYDYFFTYDRYVMDLLKDQGNKNVYYLPWGADLDKNAVYPTLTDYKYNITFVGSFNKELYPEREVFLNSIKELGLNVWGNKAWLGTGLKDHYNGTFTPDPQKINELYRSSKIVVHSDLITSIVAGTGITNRPFDVTASGSMLLAHDDRKELFEFFKDGEEFVSFHDENDLREKAEYYLNNEDKRKRIARAGFERTRSFHTFSDRIAELFNVVNGNQK